MPVTNPETARSLFVMGLKNAHALEQQATQIIGRQLDRPSTEANCAIAELKGIVSKAAVQIAANFRICLSSDFSFAL